MKKWIEGHRLSFSASVKDLFSLPSLSKEKRHGPPRSVWEKLSSLWREKRVEREVLDDIFLMQRSMLIPLILLETILLYILVPLLGNGVFVWYGVVLGVTLWRSYTSYRYLTDPDSASPEIWHRKLVLEVWVTALLFSLLGLFAIPMLPPYYQLFVFLVMIGISTAAVKTLGEDQKTAIGYLMILLLPLAVEMALLGRSETLILALLTIIYLLSQVNFLLRSHEHSVALRGTEGILQRAKELLYAREEMLQKFFEQAGEGIFTYDRDLKILDCNEAFLTLLNLSRDAVIGRKFTELDNRQLALILKAAQVEGVNGFRGLYRCYQGLEHWIEVHCSEIKDPTGEVIGGVGLIQDKTYEHLATEELEFLVSHDPLTASCNRRGFRHFMQRLLQQDEHQRLPTLFFYLDIERFKDINDIYGLEVGDRLLARGSQRLRELLPDDACLVRMGGDEFSIVIPYVPIAPEKEEAVIAEWVEQLRGVLAEPYSVRGEKIHMDWSIGVVMIEPGMTEIDELILRADLALREAKRDSKRSYVLYTEAMGTEYRRTNQLHQDILKALKEDEFCLHFQPIFRVGDTRMVSAEVLLRWNHPERGLLYPGAFLPVARQFNQVPEIDLWVLERACRQIAEWKARDNVSCPALAVNVDARLLLRESFPDLLAGLFRKYGIEGGKLTLEITEDSLVDNFDQAQKVIQELHAQGVKCAIDDFGTGYSSLSYLKKLSFDTLKIDREFVRDMLERIENIFLLQTIIDMGKRLNYTIVIEGIETEKQREIIAGIDSAIHCQGYLFSKPLPEEIFRRDYLEASV